MKFQSFDPEDHFLMIDQAGAVEATRQYVRLFQQSLITYEVVLPHTLESKTCAACGKPWEKPEYIACGIELIIEFLPDGGDRIYHRGCRPHDRWWHMLVHADRESAGAEEDGPRQLPLF